MSEIFPGWRLTANPDKDPKIHEIAVAADNFLAATMYLSDIQIIQALEELNTAIQSIKESK